MKESPRDHLVSKRIPPICRVGAFLFVKGYLISYLKFLEIILRPVGKSSSET